MHVGCFESIGYLRKVSIERTILTSHAFVGPPSSANSVEGSKFPLTQQQESCPEMRPN
jgi:hypothetical protein